MEARALARLGDAKACARALSESMTGIRPGQSGRRPGLDPVLQRVRAVRRVRALHARPGPRGRRRPVRRTAASRRRRQRSARSDFFVSLVLADAHLAAGDTEQACAMVLSAISSRRSDPLGAVRQLPARVLRHLPPTGSRRSPSSASRRQVHGCGGSRPGRKSRPVFRTGASLSGSPRSVARSPAFWPRPRSSRFPRLSGLSTLPG